MHGKYTTSDLDLEAIIKVMLAALLMYTLPNGGLYQEGSSVLAALISLRANGREGKRHQIIYLCRGVGVA
jgi:hypothetical protein